MQSPITNLFDELAEMQRDCSYADEWADYYHALTVNEDGARMEQMRIEEEVRSSW